VGSLLCVALDGLWEVDGGGRVVVLLPEHVPASAGADVVVVVVGLIWGIGLEEGGAGAVRKDEREVAEGLGEGGEEERVVLGILGEGGRGEGGELDGGIGGRCGRCGRYPVGWSAATRAGRETHVVVFTDGWRTRMGVMVRRGGV